MNSHAKFADLKGRSVYITGGASGIGAALTEGFLSQGAKVAAVGRGDADAFCAEMGAKYGDENLHYMQCDITDIEGLRASFRETEAKFGAVEVLVNNAANDQRHSLEEVDEEFWAKMIDVNFKAYFFAIQAVAPAMKAKKQGSIINLTSISYMMGNSGYPIYASSNAGLNGLTRSLARELGPDNIRVNALAPGWVMTEKQKQMWVTEEALEEQLRRQCLKRTIAPEDIVGPVLFLASEASAMVTGQALVVDGGVVGTG